MRIQNSILNSLLPITLIVGLVCVLQLNTGEVAQLPAIGESEQIVRLFVSYLALLIDLGAAVVIGIGIVRALITYVTSSAKEINHKSHQVENIRLQLGRVLTLGLEFTIAGDILSTAISTTSQEIINLTALVLLRTLLNLFLEREILHIEKIPKLT